MAKKKEIGQIDSISLIGIGKRLREIRGNTSRYDFAPLVGVSKSTLARYEQGSRAPDATFIGLLLEKFDINPVWFLYGIDEKYLSVIRRTQDPPSLEVLIKSSILYSDLLKKVIEAVEENLNLKQKTLKPAKKSQLISLLYEHFIKTDKEVDNTTVKEYLRLVV